MKQITLIASLLILSGCGTYVPMEELRAEALISGDWTKVERRERSTANRMARTGLGCPAGTMALCETKIEGDECHCVYRSTASRMFTGRW